MDFSKTPWYIPGQTKEREDLSETLVTMGFQILGKTGWYLQVNPPVGWRGEITKKGDGYEAGTISDQEGVKRIEYVEDEDTDDYNPSPADFYYLRILT